MNNFEIVLNKCDYDIDSNKFKKTKEKIILIDCERLNSDGKNSVLIKGNLKDLSGGNSHYPVIVKRRPDELSVKNWIFECFGTNKIRNLNKYDEVHFAKVVGIFTDMKNELAIILKFYSKGSLSKFIKDTNNQVTLKDKIKFIIKIIQGIMILFDNKMNHCDLKLDNILIDDNNEIKITDFGSFSLQDEHINSNVNNNLINNRIKGKYSNNKYSLRIPKYLHDVDITKIKFSENKNVFDIWCLGILILRILFNNLESELEVSNKFFDKSQPIFKPKIDEINNLFNSLDVSSIESDIDIKNVLNKLVLDCFKPRNERPIAQDLIKRLNPLTESLFR